MVGQGQIGRPAPDRTRRHPPGRDDHSPPGQRPCNLLDATLASRIRGSGISSDRDGVDTRRRPSRIGLLGKVHPELAASVAATVGGPDASRADPGQSALRECRQSPLARPRCGAAVVELGELIAVEAGLRDRAQSF